MIELQFRTDVTERQASTFEGAANRWQEVIDTDLPPVTYRGRRIGGIAIDVSIVSIDGPGNILGQAGPTILRPETRLPALGIMEFDDGDLRQLEADGSFADVILHEMGHVLGAGTLWQMAELLRDAGGPDPRFVGVAAMEEYGLLLGDAPAAVPVANTGGAGTRDGHWREITFGDELLTGFLSGRERALSRLTIASFADLGYRVDYTRADPYQLPTDEELSRRGVIRALQRCELCRVQRPTPIVIGSDASLS